MKVVTTIPIEIEIDEPALLLEEWGDDSDDDRDVLPAIEAALDDALANMNIAGCSISATCSITKMTLDLD